MEELVELLLPGLFTLVFAQLANNKTDAHASVQTFSKDGVKWLNFIKYIQIT